MSESLDNLKPTESQETRGEFEIKFDGRGLDNDDRSFPFIHSNFYVEGLKCSVTKTEKGHYGETITSVAVSYVGDSEGKSKEEIERIIKDYIDKEIDRVYEENP